MIQHPQQFENNTQRPVLYWGYLLAIPCFIFCASLAIAGGIEHELGKKDSYVNTLYELAAASAIFGSFFLFFGILESWSHRPYLPSSGHTPVNNENRPLLHHDI